MAGTLEGGKKAAIKNKARNEDFYRIIGGRGGKKGHTGGFYGNSEFARIAGKLGGSMSRRTSKKQGYESKARILSPDKALLKREFDKSYKQLLKVQQGAKNERTRQSSMATTPPKTRTIKHTKFRTLAKASV